MTDQMPVTGAPPVRVGLGRSNIVVAIVLLGFLGFAVISLVRFAIQTDDAGSKVVNGMLAVLFGAGLVLLLWRFPRMVSPRYIVLEQTGLVIQQGKERLLLPWGELVAVGIGYEVAEVKAERTPRSLDEVKEQVSGFLASHANEALQISDARRLVLEIYSARPDAVQAVARLRPYWKALPPPAPGLPEWAWRFPLPPVTSIAQQIAEGLHQRAPRHWLGWFPRPWSGPTKSK